MMEKETSIHDGFAQLAQEIATKTNVRILSVQFEYISTLEGRVNVAETIIKSEKYK